MQNKTFDRPDCYVQPHNHVQPPAIIVHGVRYEVTDRNEALLIARTFSEYALEPAKPHEPVRLPQRPGRGR